MEKEKIVLNIAIYVAESEEKGGTWSGVVDGLRKGRKIFVRKPEPNEKNANNLLIQKGAIPVDFSGVELPRNYETTNLDQVSTVREPSGNDELEVKVRAVLNGRPLNAKELLKKLNLTWTTQKLNSYLKKLDFVEVVKEKKINLYKLKGTTATTQTTLFV